MTEQAVSPLRRRMIEDMSIRKFAAKTQHDYVQRVKDLATFLGRSPGTAEAEEVRRFRLHLTRQNPARVLQSYEPAASRLAAGQRGDLLDEFCPSVGDRESHPARQGHPGAATRLAVR